MDLEIHQKIHFMVKIQNNSLVTENGMYVDNINVKQSEIDKLGKELEIQRELNKLMKKWDKIRISLGPIGGW